ncbi:unnamed protein product [Adineta steineri]|uniref:Uncharacterized protein n=1 Tax=Adineta steineri TaxID=433720 RepID=A0A819YLE6_9BILA|nr:unnamed protein product [Adineta steineri]CAF4156762.1 unnamed protein product [Adineta steineri]
MEKLSTPEDPSQKENILSTKCRILLWSWVLILISIIISAIVIVIFIRYQSSFSSTDIKYDIGNNSFL